MKQTRNKIAPRHSNILEDLKAYQESWIACIDDHGDDNASLQRLDVCGDKLRDAVPHTVQEAVALLVFAAEATYDNVKMNNCIYPDEAALMAAMPLLIEQMGIEILPRYGERLGIPYKKRKQRAAAFGQRSIVGNAVKGSDHAGAAAG